jgi:ATPase subunit of ABC transporter with duplicated ATPase domains
MDDLFHSEPKAPLAELLRPHSLDEVIGQRQLLGPGRPLSVAFQSKQAHSMILWGPPGVGKTTIARLTADAFGAEFIALSAVFAGVKDIRQSMEQARVTLEQHRRRESPFQQVAAGRTAAVCRIGPGDIHRRHHRESVLRSQFRFVVARAGVRADVA